MKRNKIMTLKVAENYHNMVKLEATRRNMSVLKYTRMFADYQNAKGVDKFEWKL